jgi:hypothetical protein
VTEQEHPLIEQIKLAFADVPYPPDGYIGGENLDRLSGHTWQSVPLDLLLWLSDEMMFFYIEGFHYFLPAFLLATLRFPDEAGTIPDGLLFAFSYEKGNNNSRFQFFSLVENFTSAQARVVRAWLDYYVVWKRDETWKRIPMLMQRYETAISFWTYYKT